MRKIVIAMNLISLVFLFVILSSVNVDAPLGATGFATAISSSTFSFHPSFVVAFLIMLLTLVLNLYFFLRKNGQARSEMGKKRIY
jgi:hypothetical protein